MAKTKTATLFRKEVRLSGFGGQGIVLAGKIIGEAASVYDTAGFATLTQNYGPEARGGSCCAEVVISNQPIGYPYVVAPGVTVIMSQEAYTKYASGLEKGTTVVIDPDLVKTDGLTNNLKVLGIPATRLAREMGRPVVANIIMLGFLAAVTDLVSAESIQQSILANVPAGTGEFNLKAFQLGYDYGMEHARAG